MSSSLGNAAAALRIIIAGMVFQSDRITVIIIIIVVIVGTAALVEARADNGAVASLLVPLPPQSPVSAEATLQVRVEVFEAERQEDAGDEGDGDIDSRSEIHSRGDCQSQCFFHKPRKIFSPLIGLDIFCRLLSSAQPNGAGGSAVQPRLQHFLDFHFQEVLRKPSSIISTSSIM